MKRTSYYSEYGERPAARSRRSLLLHLLDGLITLLTVAVAAVMAITYLVPYVNPGRIWFLPVLGLAAPAVYVASVILMLYWIIRWRWIQAGIMLVLVVLGLGRVSLFWRPEIRRSYEEIVSDRGTVKVMTYNVRSFYGPDGESSVEGIVDLIREQNPDIVCLQEFNGRLAGGSDSFRLLLDSYDISRFDETRDSEVPEDTGLVILSKYRILRSATVLTPHSSSWADLLVDEDTLRVFNNKNKLKSMNEVKDGDIFAIPSDLTNGGRALKVLEAAGLIVCDPAKGYVPTKTDITKYNVKIEIREAESGVLYNILPDVSAALINGGNAYTAGLDAVKDSIFAENINAKENPNVGQLYNVIVARSKDKDNPVYKKVVEAYHTQQTAKTLMDVYKGAFTPVWAGSENYKY